MARLHHTHTTATPSNRFLQNQNQLSDPPKYPPACQSLSPPMPHAQCINGIGNIRPKPSLSEHVEIQRDFYSTSLQPRPSSRRGPIPAGTKRIKTFLIATVGGVKRVTVATSDRQGIRVGRHFKRSVTTLPRAPMSNSTSPKKNRRRKHRSLKISNPILIPDLSDMNPFLAARSPVQSVSPQLNPPASTDGLLRAYGVQQGQASSHIHPPPACPTFPPGHKCRTSRVHVRPRPRSARPVSRGSTKSSPATSRPLSRSSSNEAAESLRQARAYISTDSCACNEVVGPSSLHEETEPPPLCLSTPISWSRPVSISDPTIPEVRTRTAIVQVVSQGTQTDAPLPPPKMRTRATNTSVDLSVNTPNPLETPKPRPRNARKSRNRERQSAIPSEATPPRSSESRGDESPTSHLNVVSPGISFSTPDYSTRSPRWDGHEIAPDDDHLSLHQVETIAESMDQYYLARQRDIARRNSHVPHEMSGETNRIDVFRRGRAPAPQYRGSLPSPAIERSPVERGVNGQFLSAGIRNGGQVSGRKNSFDDLQRDEPLFKETTAKAPEKQSDRHHHRRDATVKRFRDPSSSQSSQPEFTASLFTPNYPPTPRNSLSAPSSTADAAHPNHTPISYHNVPVAARVSGGPLSLTADRYRGAKTPVSPTSRPSVVVTNRHQRVGLSMDTARSVSGASESELSTVIRRDSFGNIWHSQRDDSSYWRGMHVE